MNRFTNSNLDMLDMDIVDAQMEKFTEKYQENLKPIVVSFRSLCSSWPWARRSECYTHLMHKYPAKILPYIPIFFLSSESYASSTDTILDPFAGTGTVLLESIIHPYFKRDAIGVEINPLARLIAKVKTTPLDTDELRKEADTLISRIKAYSGDVADIPEFPNREMWFSHRIQTELAKIRICIEEVENLNFRDFFFVCFSSIIREVSLADPRIPPPVILNPKRFEKDPERENEVAALLRKKKWARPTTYFKRKIERNIERIETLNQITELHDEKVKSEIIWDDARKLRKGKLTVKGEIDKTKAEDVEDGSIGMVITSPPYINAQKYIRTTKFELFWLGLVDKSEIIELDKKFVGTERVYRSEYSELLLTGIDSADRVIKRIYEKDRERASIVSKYFSDMRQVMREVHRVLKKGGRFILVIGDNTVRGTKVENHKILVDMAIEDQDGGFEVETIMVDRIRARGMITKRHKSGGLVSDDWIIVFKKGE